MNQRPIPKPRISAKHRGRHAIVGELRSCYGLSPRAVQFLTGVPAQTIRAWERASLSPAPDRRFARFYIVNRADTERQLAEHYGYSEAQIKAALA